MNEALESEHAQCIAESEARELKALDTALTQLIIALLQGYIITNQGLERKNCSGRMREGQTKENLGERHRVKESG